MLLFDITFSERRSVLRSPPLSTTPAQPAVLTVQLSNRMPEPSSTALSEPEFLNVQLKNDTPATELTTRAALLCTHAASVKCQLRHYPPSTITRMAWRVKTKR